jgi:hypothetical protein
LLLLWRAKVKKKEQFQEGCTQSIHINLFLTTAYFFEYSKVWILGNSAMVAMNIPSFKIPLHSCPFYELNLPFINLFQNS